jgi:signal transduction histidine kinase
VLILTGAALSSYFQRTAIKQTEATIGEIAESLFADTTVGTDGAVREPAFTDLKAKRVYSGRYWQIAEPKPGGIRWLVRSDSLFQTDEIAPPAGGVERLALQMGKPIFYDTVGPQDKPLRAVAIMALVKGRTEPLIFMAAEDRSTVDAASRQFTTMTGFALVALGLGLVVAVFLQVRFGLQPLFALGREIAEVRKGKIQRLSGRYPREVAPLADEMNALLDHNTEVVERQRTHVGNLAHALKTPLAVLTGEAERHKGPMSELVAAQAGIMRGQVEHHLRRARAAARAQSAGERTEVEPAIDELAVMLETVFQDKQVEIDWRVPDGLCFRGERQDFLEVIGNLLENACKWCRKRVLVTAEVVADGVFRLSVEDDGPGLPEEQRAEVLKRGARLDESAPGSGLGLSIVDELARAYGGTVRLDASSLGGLKVSVDFPAAET